MKTKNKLGGQFSLSGEMASLEARQAAAFGYIKGYLSLHFKHSTELTPMNYRYMAIEVKKQFGIDLQPE